MKALRLRLLAMALCAIGGLSGCARHTLIQQTQFQLSDFRGTAQTLQGTLKKVRVEIDRKAGKVTFTHTNGTQEVVSFVVRPRDQWMHGCPGKPEHKMELLALQVPQVIIGRFTIRKPVLQAANCRADAGLLLRQAGQVKSPTAWECQMAQMCLRFKPITPGK